MRMVEIDHIDSRPELVFSRAFNAPVAAVYRAWTEPERLKRWWGPKGFTLTIHRLELRVGGIWDYILHGPDGTDYPNRAEYEVIEPQRRLIFFNEGGHVADRHLTSRMTATFETRDAQTLVELRMAFIDEAARLRAVDRGAEEGGRQSFERLAELLA